MLITNKMCACAICVWGEKEAQQNWQKNMKMFPHKLFFFLIIIYSIGVRLLVSRVSRIQFFMQNVWDKKISSKLCYVYVYVQYKIKTELGLSGGGIRQSKGKSIDFLTLYYSFHSEHITPTNIIACLLEYDTLIK